jgi:hypothetical protein
MDAALLVERRHRFGPHHLAARGADRGKRDVWVDHVRSGADSNCTLRPRRPSRDSRGERARFAVPKRHLRPRLVVRCTDEHRGQGGAGARGQSAGTSCRRRSDTSRRATVGTALAGRGNQPFLCSAARAQVNRAGDRRDGIHLGRWSAAWSPALGNDQRSNRISPDLLVVIRGCGSFAYARQCQGVFTQPLKNDENVS